MKKSISFLVALVFAFSAVVPAYSAERTAVSDWVDLRSSMSTTHPDGYVLNNDIERMKCSGIACDFDLVGDGHCIESDETGGGAVIFQNDPVTSSFSDLGIVGNQKYDVGLWIGSGRMTMNNVTVSDFIITSGRYSAVAVGGNGTLVLNACKFADNNRFDINICDSSAVYINKGTVVPTLRFSTPTGSLNIGSGWSGKMSITFDSPIAKTIGTVDDTADISGITVTNDSYYVAKDNGALVLKKSANSTIRFDMSGRDKLYKGSMGFLYGCAEINVPTIDLLQGLQPDTMVQKAMGGKQHPTGDAIRTRSALLSAGVRDMQIYLQDHYLEWPYDAPMIDKTIDVDGYQKTVESILYSMICTPSSASDKSAFRGTDGRYYKLNKSVASQYSYVLFNEPDQIWYGGNLAGLEKAWMQIYTAVHRIDPDACCVGPNYSGYNPSDYNHFLAFCRDNNCLPEIISWHELGDISLTDFYAHYDSVQGFVDKYYTDFRPQLMVNEYARHYDIGSPGGLVKWLAMFEDKDMSGCMAYWALANSLNEIAADQNSPSSSWWVYHWYAMMTGDQCPITYPDFDKTRFYGVSSYDSDINMAYALFGGSEDEGVGESVRLDNMSATKLVNNGTVNVKLYGVHFSGQQGATYSPEVIFDDCVSVIGDTLCIDLDSTDEMDAYFAVVTRPDDGAVPASDTVSAQFSTLSYEAEDARLLGNATAYGKYGWATFATSGRADVGNIVQNGDGVEFSVSVDNTDDYVLSLFYSLQSPYVDPLTLQPDASGQNRGIGRSLPFGVTIDGKKYDDIILNSTVSWAYKNHCDFTARLSVGEHTIAFTHINGDESQKGNLQLTAALDKLDVTPVGTYSDMVSIDLGEMSSFATDNGYRLTVVAPRSGYYNVACDNDVSLFKQCVDYAPDARSTSECSVYDVAIGKTVYLSQGANTIVIEGSANKISFTYDAEKSSSGTTITAQEFTLHGNNPTLVDNAYSTDGKTVDNIGVGQSADPDERGECNYIAFTVSAKTDGVYNLAVRYSNDEPAPVMEKANGETYIHPYNIDLVERYAQISVNGSEPETVYFRNTLSWDTFRIFDVQVKLNKGDNTIRIYNDNSYRFSSLVNSTAPVIDSVSISRLTYDGTTVVKCESAPSVKHNMCIDDDSYVAPTCNKYGKQKDYYCPDCGYRQMGAPIALVDHTYATTKATLTKNGTVKCTKCGAVKSTIYYPKTITLSATKYTYDGKVKKPTVKVVGSNGKNIAVSNYTVTYASGRKNVGKYTVKVTFKGNYSGSKILYFNINPKGTTLSSVSAGSKCFTAKWKKQATQTTGYQIQYATNSSFKSAKTVTVKKNSTTSTKVAKLTAKKKYYVRIRTYKTVNKVNYYSAWSGTKTVTTKK